MLCSYRVCIVSVRNKYISHNFLESRSRKQLPRSMYAENWKKKSAASYLQIVILEIYYGTAHIFSRVFRVDQMKVVWSSFGSTGPL